MLRSNQAPQRPAIILLGGSANLPSNSSVSQDEVLADIRDGMKELSTKDADAFGHNFMRFMKLQADQRGLPRPGSVKGKPIAPLPEPVPMHYRAQIMMAGLEAFAAKTPGPITWGIFEDKAISTYLQASTDKIAPPAPANPAGGVFVIGIE